MIALLTGEVRSLGPEKLVLDVNGVGYQITITAPTAAHIAMGTRITLHTTLVVREDSMTLFGFLEEERRNLFESVQTVSGIGPKVALSIVAALTPEELARAVAQEDIAAISKVPGIGRKGAQRLILELKGKLSDMSGMVAKRVSVEPWREQVLAAMTSLGFTVRDAESAIDRFVRTSEATVSELPIEEILREVLAQGRKR